MQRLITIWQKEKYSRGETKMDMEKIMAYVEKIAENLEGLVCAIGCDSMPCVAQAVEIIKDELIYS